MSRAKNGSSTKIGVVWQKSDFLAKNRNFGPKKRESLLVIHHVLATTRKSCSKKKVPFFQNKYQSFRKFWVFCWDKCIFGQKTTKFGSKLAILVILVQALPANLVPCWWVGWWLWRTGCISQDTYLLCNMYFRQ